MRNYLLIIILAIAATSCASVKPSTGKQAAAPASKKTISSNSSATVNLQFIRGIETQTEKKSIVHDKPAYTAAANATTVNNSFDIEKANSLQFTYAAKLGLEVESITNLKLFELIDEWWGTQYRMGGTTKDGVDCSAFVLTMMSAVYGINLPRTSREQYDAAVKINDEELKEGDLVFFNTRGGISHVGIYLANNKFVHASTSGGVMISDLNETYWRAKYKGAGRVK